MSMLMRRAFMNTVSSGPSVASLFSAYPYTGNGGSQSITNGLNLSGIGGMVWTAARTVTTGQPPNVNDTVRGGNVELRVDTTSAQSTLTSILAFTSSGFSLVGYDYNNHNGWTYASWSFVKAARFFDFGTYTGTGAARTISHALTLTPGTVAVKRTDGVGGWVVYHNALASANDYLQLSSSSAASTSANVWNGTAPTSSVFSVGVDSWVNASGGSYVWYAFAHDTASDGITHCGGFSTDGSGNATITIGWEPQYVLFKNRGATQDWLILDTARGWASGADKRLAISTTGEATATDYGAPTSTGFTVTGLSASANYVYLAIRKP